MDYETARSLLQAAHGCGQSRVRLLELFVDPHTIVDATLKSILEGDPVRARTQNAAIAAALRLRARDCRDCQFYDLLAERLAPNQSQNPTKNYLGKYSVYIRDSQTEAITEYKAGIESCPVCQRPRFWIKRQGGDIRKGHVYFLPLRIYLVLLEPFYARFAILKQENYPDREEVVGMVLLEHEDLDFPIAAKVVFIHEKHPVYGKPEAEELADRLIYNETRAKGVLCGWSKKPRQRRTR